MSIDKRLAIKPALNQFNGGEISPYLEGRYDWDKYNYSAKLCKNFIPTIEGSLKRRGGSHFVALKRGSGEYTFRIYIELGYHHYPLPTPTLVLNGETLTLHNTGQYFSSNTFYTDELTYLDGTILNYTITATDYYTKTGSLTVNINQSDVILKITASSADIVTVDFIAPTSATITLNGTTATSISDTVGTSVTYSISYLTQTLTGTITIFEDKKYYVFMVGDELMMSDSEALLVDSSDDGSIYLPACKIRYIGVGGGGGYINFKGNVISGGSGAGCDIILDVSEGAYNWQVGNYGGTGTNGEDTYLKNLSTNIVTNGGGKTGYRDGSSVAAGGAGGINTIDSNYVVKTNWNKNGNACTWRYYTWDRFRHGSPIRGSSVYNDYGTGSGITSSGTYADGTGGYLYISFVED